MAFAKWSKKGINFTDDFDDLVAKNKFVTSHDMPASQLYYILDIFDMGHVDKYQRHVSIIYQLNYSMFIIMYRSRKVYYMLLCSVFNYFYLKLSSTVFNCESSHNYCNLNYDIFFCHKTWWFIQSHVQKIPSCTVYVLLPNSAYIS